MRLIVDPRYAPIAVRRCCPPGFALLDLLPGRDLHSAALSLHREPCELRILRRRLRGGAIGTLHHPSVTQLGDATERGEVVLRAATHGCDEVVVR